MPIETVTRDIRFSTDEIADMICEKLQINPETHVITINAIEGQSDYDGPGFSRGPFAGLRITVTKSIYD